MKCQYAFFFVPQSQKQIAVSRSKGTAHRRHGPGEGGGAFLLSLFSPRGLGSPRHPALVAVRWRGARKSPETHAHPHADALG